MEDMQGSLIQAMVSAVKLDSDGFNTSFPDTERNQVYAGATPIGTALVFIKAAATVAAESRSLMTCAAVQFGRSRLRPPNRFKGSEYQRLHDWHGDRPCARCHHIERRTSQAVLDTTLRFDGLVASSAMCRSIGKKTMSTRHFLQHLDIR